MLHTRQSIRQAAQVWYGLPLERRIMLCLDGMAFYAAKSDVPAWLFWRWLFGRTVLDALADRRLVSAA